MKKTCNYLFRCLEKKWVFTISVLLFMTSAFGQNIKISGNVLDENGLPLLGANIIEAGTTNGTLSDFDGNFTMSISNINAKLVFSFIGYTTEEVLIKGKTSVTVRLNPDTQDLGEVVIIGYGSSRKKDLVSSVSKVDSEVIQNQPTVRLDQALQGRAAGVEVTSSNGAPGSGATIRIRGASSINGNNDPLFVIDGFIAGTDFDLNTINVNDVDSIEILKDATALSIYGTRGAAGVILVTTKNGKNGSSGKPLISVNHYSTVQSLANKIEVLKGVEYLKYKNEEGQFVPGASGFGESNTSLPLIFPDLANVPNTDWVELISRVGLINNTDISIAGKTDKNNYYVSLNRFEQEGVLKNSGLERYVLRTNLDFKISDKLKSGVRMNISDYKKENTKVDFGNIITNVLPIRAIYDADGNFTSQNPVSSKTERNPVADTQLRQDQDDVTNITSNLYVEYEVLKGLTFKSTFGADLNFFKNSIYLPRVLPERLAGNNGGEATISQSQSRNLLNENTINFQKTFGDHSLSVLAGATWQKNVISRTRTLAGGFVNDATGFHNLSSGSNSDTYQVNSGYLQRTFASLLSRINYSYKSKYLLTLVGRRDGSSVFEDGNKYAFFPSVGAAWNLDEEEFIKSVSAISALKLRSSYGVVGEQGVQPYNSFATFKDTNTYFNESLVGGVLIGELASSNLSWETTKQFDLGVELALFNSRLSFEVDYYKKTTKDLLLERKVPGTAGDVQLQNIGSVENKGFDFSINSINISNDNFSWETSLSVSSNKNKVLDLGGADFIDLRSPSNELHGAGLRLIVGQPVPAFVGATYLGTYKTQQEIIDDGRQGISFIGSPRYKDLDGNSVITDADKVVIGSPQPDFYGGLRNAFKYKGLSFDFFFQFSQGNDIWNAPRQTALFGRGDSNLSPDVVNRWVAGVNETSNIPRAGTSTSIYNPNSNLVVEDGSFIRLKTMTIAYNLPMDKIGNNLFNSINVYVSGNNLLLFSDFTLGDPEVSNYGGALEQGVAAGQYPYARSFTAGIKLNF